MTCSDHIDDPCLLRDCYIFYVHSHRTIVPSMLLQYICAELNHKPERAQGHPMQHAFSIYIQSSNKKNEDIISIYPELLM